jgi:hypothetical protein
MLGLTTYLHYQFVKSPIVKYFRLRNKAHKIIA